MPATLKRSRHAETHTLYTTAREQVRELEAALAQQREYAGSVERDNERLRDLVDRLTTGPWNNSTAHWLKRIGAIAGQAEQLALLCPDCDRNDRQACNRCSEVAVFGTGLSAVVRAWREQEGV